MLENKNQDLCTFAVVPLSLDAKNLPFQLKITRAFRKFKKPTEVLVHSYKPILPNYLYLFRDPVPLSSSKKLETVSLLPLGLLFEFGNVLLVKLLRVV
jgi:hypothetical protein